MESYSCLFFFFFRWFKLLESYPELFIRCSFEVSVIYRDILENNQNSQENTCARVSFILCFFFESPDLLKFTKFLRTSILQNSSARLLLDLVAHSTKTNLLLKVAFESNTFSESIICWNTRSQPRSSGHF